MAGRDLQELSAEEAVMAKYRKKPIVVEAEQFFPGLLLKESWPEGVERIGRVPSDPTSLTGFRLKTLEGWFVVSPYDWIITGIKGEKYPCKPDIFEATYEKVEE
jgi:hypothetical protein